MKVKSLVSVLLLAFLVLPMAARADVVFPGQKRPRNEQSETFVKLYADGITTWDSAYDYAYDGVEEVVLWRYPNSGRVVHITEARNISLHMDPCYIDKEGRFWGYISYSNGYRQVWVCLSDPANEDLPADKSVVAAVNKEITKMRWGENAPAVVLVAAVVAVTARLLYVFWYKKKKEQG